MLSFLSKVGQWFLGTKVELPPEKISALPTIPVNESVVPVAPIEFKTDLWVSDMAKKILLLIEQWDICADQTMVTKVDDGGIIVVLDDAITSRELTFVISPDHLVFFSATDNVTKSRLAGIVEEPAIQPMIIWRSYMSLDFPTKGIILGRS